MRAALTRDLVVAAARSALERGGDIRELSLRGVARDLGVTAPALYAYVDDKADLLAAVAAEHFDLLVARFDAVDVVDPLERIRALGRAYVDHALASPALFRLMFRFPPVPVSGSESFAPATRAFETAAQAMVDAVASGQLAVTDPQLASMTMWAALHGVSEVLLLGFGFDAAATEALVTSVIETVLAGQVHPLASSLSTASAAGGPGAAG